MSSGAYTGPERVVSLSERRDIIAGVLSPLSPQWEPDGSWGYVACPGADCHNNANGRRDCRVFACEAPGTRVKPPGLYCLHTSCAGVLGPLNFRIRSEIGKAKVKGLPPRGSSSYSAPGHSRTPRTDIFKAPTKEGGASRTPRTDISKPLERFARAQVRTHVPRKEPPVPSVPSVVASTMPGVVAKQAEGTPEDSECTLIIGNEVQRGFWKGGEWVTKTQK